jgi:hypothetical protein
MTGGRDIGQELDGEQELDYRDVLIIFCIRAYQSKKLNLPLP